MWFQRLERLNDFGVAVRISMTTQGPWWGYFKSQFQLGLLTFDYISPQKRTNGSKNEHGIPPRRTFCGARGSTAYRKRARHGQILALTSALFRFIWQGFSPGPLSRFNPCTHSTFERRLQVRRPNREISGLQHHSRGWGRRPLSWMAAQLMGAQVLVSLAPPDATGYHFRRSKSPLA
jgi:hypothetical protein